MTRRLVVAVVAFVLAPIFVSADVAAVRRNFENYYIAARSGTDGVRMQQALWTLEDHVRSLTSDGYLRADGSWTDINYSPDAPGSWTPWEHVKRLTVMSKAYSTRGQSHYRNPVLLADIEAALNYTQVFYAPNSRQPSNWWFWPIGVPLELGPTLILIGDDVQSSTTEAVLKSVEKHIGPTPFVTPSGSILSGQNLVWSAFNHLCVATLRSDASRMKQARDAIISVTRFGSSSGVQSDFSFHQHGAQLYTGGYGGSYAYEVSKYGLLVRGTEFELPSENAAFVANYLVDGIAWSLYDKYFDVSVISREVARSSSTGYNGLAALLHASDVASLRQSEIRRAGAKMLRSWNWTLPTELARAAEALEASGVTPAWPAGFRHYPLSDYSVLRTPKFFASIKMFSARTKSGENTSEENKLGSRQSDGRLYLAIRGDEYYASHAWPTLDWARLPGITVEQKPDAANATYGYGSRTFVGGAGDGRNGVAAMDLVPVGSQISAKKGWFFLDDAIVFTTTGVSSSSDQPVETIVQQWPLSSSATPLIVNGATASLPAGSATVLRAVSWAVSDRIGYYFPAPSDVSVKQATQTGTWSLIGNATDPTPLTNPILTMWIDHGIRPLSAEAEYVIVPDLTPQAMSQWVASNPVSIVRNDPIATAVRDNRSGVLGIVFWTWGVSVEGFVTDKAAIVQVRPTATGLQIAVADPTHAAGVIRLTVPGRYSLQSGNATVLSSAKRATVLEIPRSGGRTSVIELESYQRRRGVRR